MNCNGGGGSSAAARREENFAELQLLEREETTMHTNEWLCIKPASIYCVEESLHDAPLAATEYYIVVVVQALVCEPRSVTFAKKN